MFLIINAIYYLVKYTRKNSKPIPLLAQCLPSYHIGLFNSSYSQLKTVFVTKILTLQKAYKLSYVKNNVKLNEFPSGNFYW